MNWLRASCLLVLLAATAVAADWPQWLGPHRDGESPEKIKPWKDDLKVVWRKKVGPGHSSPVVAGGKVFLHTRGKNKPLPDSDKEQEYEEVTAYDALTGKKEWNTSYPRAHFASLFGTGPQATPAVAGGKVFTYGANGILACFDAAKGGLLWQVDTWKDFDVGNAKGDRQPRFGVAGSPLLDGKNVIVNVGGKDASVVAFSRVRGKVAWKSLDDKTSYSSGIESGKGKERQLIFLTQKELCGLAPADGKKLWGFPFVDKLDENATTPVLAGDLILASSIKSGMAAVKVEKKDGKLTASQVWKNPKLTCYFSTPVLVGKKHAYVVTGTISIFPSSTLHCVEVESGNILWSKPKVGRWHAALLKTGDDKLLMLNDYGDLILFDPDAKGYKELARAKVSKSQIWAHPALADGKLYFRDDKELVCLQMP
jgi:outer membrane protein assembly factor BamB